ncbi:MAG: class I SAM-dependent methyltransferase [Firmicutes bacterium]|nr:class I SAM-dependent methyltransferase [Bacillota bacterium]
MIADKWADYEIIATGGGEKLEKWGDVVLLRPDPQVIWPAAFDLSSYKGLCAKYTRSSSGGGSWERLKKIPDEWTVGYKDYKFSLKLMGFKHVGLFPEQASNWDLISGLIKNAGRQVNVLNLFAYTGGASVAAAMAGAKVTHVDAAKGMVERAGLNAKLSNIPNDKIRYIVDDCAKFVTREIKRGVRYDAVIMDPPSFGRGAGGEVWRLEDNLYSLVKLCSSVLADNPLFFLINSYTTGLQSTALENVLSLGLGDKISGKGKVEGYEVCLSTGEGIPLPCGYSAMYK